jgi:tRNA-2-methylthio-N6-dimethylallyladenosine synthase
VRPDTPAPDTAAHGTAAHGTAAGELEQRRRQPARPDARDSGLVQLRRGPARTGAPAAEDDSALPDADRSGASGASAAAPRLYLETYGCQMNVADSDLLTGLLTGAGYRRTATPADADLIVINTCAVREKAEERVFARATELGAHKRRGRDVVLAVVGCMAEHLKGRISERAPEVDIIAGPDSYRRIAALAQEARGMRGAPALVDVKLDRSETYEGLAGAEGGDGVSAFITIQRGCDKFCTFCVVPYTRGRERGVAPREVLRQARLLAESGHREVVLLGQTVNSYRHEEVGFAELLRAVARVDGIERIRFTSPYPVDFTAEVIEVMASEPKVCKYVHLPVQSGSDQVLARMRRGYTVAEFHRLVEALRGAMPQIALSSDILSGFCGETEADHEATLALMRTLRFDSAFMFSYSERELTYAARRLPDDVSPAVKKRRLAEIIALQERISTEVHAAQVGKRERVLIHGRSKRSEDQLVARTDGFKAVVVPASCGQPGAFVDVEIVGATMATLHGRPLPA